ncbi:hypothetical protein Tco_0592190, partial [Tanacetum coccineum]
MMSSSRLMCLEYEKWVFVKDSFEVVGIGGFRGGCWDRWWLVVVGGETILEDGDEKEEEEGGGESEGVVQRGRRHGWSF